MDIKLIFFIIFLFIVVGCSSSPSTDTIETIDIEKAFDNPSPIFLSDFSTDEIEYIPLETTSESLISGSLDVLVSGEYIIAFALRNTLLFERKTGKFIRVIANVGSGHRDYVHSTKNTAFDEDSQTITRGATNNGGIEYDLNGNVIRKMEFPGFSGSGNLIPLDKNSLAMYIYNFKGDEPFRLHIYDKKGNVLNKFQNYHSFEAKKGYSTRSVITYRFKNDVFFYENCVDTVYKITPDSLIPHLYLHLGRFHPPYSEIPDFPYPQENPKRKKYFIFNVILESDRFLFFSFSHDKKNRTGPHPSPLSKYFGFCDKKSGIVKISEVDHTDKSPIFNDIDDFVPLYLNSMMINRSGEMAMHLDAENILEWFDENPDKASRLPDHIQALSKLEPDDNPVVVVFKPKSSR